MRFPFCKPAFRTMSRLATNLCHNRCSTSGVCEVPAMQFRRFTSSVACSINRIGSSHTSVRTKGEKAVVFQNTWDPGAASTGSRIRGRATKSSEITRIAADGILYLVEENGTRGMTGPHNNFFQHKPSCSFCRQYQTGHALCSSSTNLQKPLATAGKKLECYQSRHGNRGNTLQASKVTTGLSRNNVVNGNSGGQTSPRQQEKNLHPTSEASEEGLNRNQPENRTVVIVESPSKAKTIEKYLGRDYIVLPTYGHVRDLAARAGSVRPDLDYTLLWEVPFDARDHLNKIKAALENTNHLVLASDPDREGEAIAWHVSELMNAEGALQNGRVKVSRVAFNEITETAVTRAMNDPRIISMPLVTAYLARRALDYLIGFGLSPLLWRKLPGSKSAGRVQSAALALACEREKEIEEFIAHEYWSVEGDACLATDLYRDNDDSIGNPCLDKTVTLFPVRPTHVDGMKLEQLSLGSEEKARDLAERLSLSKFSVLSVKKGFQLRNPPMPYITSTLQKDGLNKLGFSALRTMALAQQLYEGVKLGNDELTGLITYMRTDGCQLADEAVKNIRAFASQRFGEGYVPVDVRILKTKVKNAQEAHEAIRPTDIYRIPSMLVDVLEEDALRLYSLIWSRTMACQMKPAVFTEVAVEFTAQEGKLKLRAHSSFLSFTGFMAALQDRDANLLNLKVLFERPVAEVEESKVTEKLPILKEGDQIVLKRTDIHQHFTLPPRRYSEASLVMKLEELGIGRPSTYAHVLKTLQLRNYVRVEKFYIFPEARGRMVSAFLSHFFPNFMNYSFTASLEEQLDEISAGRMYWKDVVRSFWPGFNDDINTTMQVPVPKVVDLLQETFANQFFKGLGMSMKVCPSCGVGKIALKLSRYGSGYFFGCDAYPACRFKTNVISDEESESLDIDPEESEVVKSVIPKKFRTVGVDPATGRQVLVKLGPFGYYIQLGGDEKKTERTCFRIPDNVKPEEITVEKAIELMKYPFSLGKHPEDGEPVWLGIGRRTFYAKHRAALAHFPKDMQPEEMTLEKAIELLKGDTVKFRGRKRTQKVENKRKTQGLGIAGRQVEKKVQSSSVKHKAATGTPLRKEVQSEGIKQKDSSGGQKKQGTGESKISEAQSGAADGKTRLIRQGVVETDLTEEVQSRVEGETGCNKNQRKKGAVESKGTQIDDTTRQNRKGAGETEVAEESHSGVARQRNVDKTRKKKGTVENKVTHTDGKTEQNIRGTVKTKVTGNNRKGMLASKEDCSANEASLPASGSGRLTDMEKQSNMEDAEEAKVAEETHSGVERQRNANKNQKKKGTVKSKVTQTDTKTEQNSQGAMTTEVTGSKRKGMLASKGDCSAKEASRPASGRGRKTDVDKRSNMEADVSVNSDNEMNKENGDIEGFAIQHDELQAVG